MEAIDGRTARRLFMTICQFPAMRASWLREIVVGSSGEVSRHLKRFVDTGLVAVFDGRHYLSELGMRRAANMSRVLPAVIRSRHGAYLDRWYREHEQHHHDGVNRLVVRFAREGVEVMAVFVTNLNLTTYCYEPTAIACSWPNTKDQTSHLPIRRCNTRSLAGKPLAGFRATPDRRIIVLCGMIVSVIRFKNPLLHRQSSLRKRRLGENRGFRPSF